MAETIQIVRQGESLSSIAQRHYGSSKLWPSVYAHSNVLAARRRPGFRYIVDPNRIRVGDRLALPTMPHAARRALANDPAMAAVPPQLAPAVAPDTFLTLGASPARGHLPVFGQHGVDSAACTLLCLDLQAR